MSDQEGPLNEFLDNEDQSDWSTEKLDSLLTELLTGNRPTGGGHDEGEYISIGGTQIDSEGYIDLHDLVYIPEEYFEKVSDTLLQRHDILMVKDGANTGDVAIAWEGRPDIVTNEHLMTLRLRDDVNPPYNFYYLLSHEGWKQLKGTITGSAQEGINKSFAGKVDVSYPPLEEQRKIASVIYTVDQAIQNTKEIVNQTRRLRTAAVRSVFRHGPRDHDSFQETQSGLYPDSWDIVKFEGLIEDTRYGTDHKSNSEGEGYPTLRIPNIVDKRITTEDLKHTPLDDIELRRLQLKDNDILTIRTNGNPNYVGRCATFSERDEPYVFASYLIRIRVDESSVRPAFIREFMNSNRGRSEMSGWIRSSAGNYNLSVGAIEKFEVPVPPISEQDEIIEKIDRVERMARSNERYQNLLERLKQGLMQDLLSGEVRTNDKDIEVLDEVHQHG